MQTLPIMPPAAAERPAAAPAPGEPSRGGFADALRDAAGAREADETAADDHPLPARGAADAPERAVGERRAAAVGRARHERCAAEGTDAASAARDRDDAAGVIDPASGIRPARAEAGGDAIDGTDADAAAHADAPAGAATPGPVPGWITALASRPQGNAALANEQHADGTAALRPADAAASRAASSRALHGSARHDTERARDDAARSDLAAPLARLAQSDTPSTAALGAALAATSRPGGNPDALAAPALPPMPMLPTGMAPLAATDAVRADVATATLRDPLGSRGFEQQLGQQLGVWVRDGVQEARLHLHPAELGPVAISITLDGNAAQVDFHAAHARTREAIEASLPALALALREGGFTLAGGGVFGQSAGNGHAGDRAAASPPPARDESPAALPSAAVGAPPERSAAWRRGLLDVFA